MKKTLLLSVLVTIISLHSKAQCAFGNFPPSFTANAGWTNGSWLAQKYTLANTATLTGLGLNSAAGSGIPFRMVIYTDASNVPGNLIAASNQATMALGLNVLSIPANTVIPAGTYWIAVLYNGSGPTTYSTGGTQMAYQPGSISSPPANNSVWTTGSSFQIDYWAVINSPTVTISGPTLACTGSSVTLTAGGAATYTWSNGAITNSISVSPTTNTVYSLVGIGSNGCPGASSTSLTSQVSPSVSIAGNTIICADSSLSQTVSGAVTYTWSNGATTPTILASPSSSTLYTVTGTDLAGCTGSASVAVTVNALPNLSQSGNNSLCTGSSLSQTVTGASSYTWNTGANTSTISISPTSNTVLSVSGTDANGCIGSSSMAITVNALPVLTVTSSSALLCIGETASLTVGGATSCTWNTGATGISFTGTPTLTTTYTLTGTDQNGCGNTASFTQSVAMCTGIQKSTTELSATIFPNPGNGIFELKISQPSETVTFKIFNSAGMPVKQENPVSANFKIDLTAYPEGLYYMILDTNQGRSIIKLIKE